MPAADVNDPEQRGIESREFEGEKLGREAGAEEGAAPPGGGESYGVVGVEVGEEVGLAAGSPSVHRYHSALHRSEIELSGEILEEYLARKCSIGFIFFFLVKNGFSLFISMFQNIYIYIVPFFFYAFLLLVSLVISLIFVILLSYVNM